MAIGATIQDDRGKELATVSQLLGKGTNNIAEYRAGIEGLKNAWIVKIRRQAMMQCHS